MNPFALFAVLLTLTAVFAYLNERLLRLPTSVGVLVGALAASMVALGLGAVGVGAATWARRMVAAVPFDDVLMNGMLSFLLFAGALHVNLDDLLRRRWSVLLLATFGVSVSTLLVGCGTWWVVNRLGLDLPLGHAMIFGALISPTDPIAVMGLLRRAGVPKDLEAMIAGESLFNDGVGVVVFLLVTGVVLGGQGATPQGVAWLFGVEVFGGAALGLALGYLTYSLLRSVDQYVVEVLLTLALVAGGYSLAVSLHTSGPLAMVMAGLLIGNRGRVLAMSETTRLHLDQFWELLDEILNAMLFLMIGLEVLVLDLEPRFLAGGVLAIPVVVLARLAAAATSVGVLRRWRSFPPYTVRLLTWGGLRGGISVALALSLPRTAERDLLLVCTYIVVVFSILVQGLTVGSLARRAVREA